MMRGTRIRVRDSRSRCKNVNYGVGRRIGGSMSAIALRYRAVLFDLDGTLVDSYNALTEAVNHARRTHGLPELSSTDIRDMVGEGLERLLQKAFDRAELSPSIVHAFESRYDDICCAESHVLEEVEVTLRQLHDLGVAMAVCTNKPTAFSKKILDFL